MKGGTPATSAIFIVGKWPAELFWTVLWLANVTIVLTMVGAGLSSSAILDVVGSGSAALNGTILTHEKGRHRWWRGMYDEFIGCKILHDFVDGW